MSTPSDQDPVITVGPTTPEPEQPKADAGDNKTAADTKEAADISLRATRTANEKKRESDIVATQAAQANPRLKQAGGGDIVAEGDKAQAEKKEKPTKELSTEKKFEPKKVEGEISWPAFFRELAKLFEVMEEVYHSVKQEIQNQNKITKEQNALYNANLELTKAKENLHGAAIKAKDDLLEYGKAKNEFENAQKEGIPAKRKAAQIKMENAQEKYEASKKVVDDLQNVVNEKEKVLEAIKKEQAESTAKQKPKEEATKPEPKERPKEEPKEGLKEEPKPKPVEKSKPESVEKPEPKPARQPAESPPVITVGAATPESTPEALKLDKIRILDELRRAPPDEPRLPPTQPPPYAAVMALSGQSVKDQLGVVNDKSEALVADGAKIPPNAKQPEVNKDSIGVMPLHDVQAKRAEVDAAKQAEADRAAREEEKRKQEAAAALAEANKPPTTEPQVKSSGLKPGP